jgi:hypothetical protein
MNGPKVDEVICKALKPTAVDAMFLDIWIAGQDLFFPTNHGKTLTIMRRCWALTRIVKIVDTSGFASKAETRYMALWMEVHDATDYSTCPVREIINSMSK